MFIHEGAFYDYCDEAVEYIEKHNREKADECIEKAALLTDRVGVAGEYPNYASVFFEIANIYSDKKNCAKAIEYYDLARKKYVCYSEGYYYANCSGHLDNAVKCCIYTLFLDPNNAEAYRNKGLAYYAKEEYNKAIECYEKAISLKPDYVYAYNDMGIASRFKKDYDKAIECYSKALELNPNYTEAWNNMGIVYVDKGNYDRAMECYEKAAESDVEKAKIAYCNMGNAYERKGDYDKAIKSWEKAIALDRYFTEAYHYISMAYETMGDKNRAAEYKKKTERAELMQFAHRLIC